MIDIIMAMQQHDSKVEFSESEGRQVRGTIRDLNPAGLRWNVNWWTMLECGPDEPS